MNAKSDDSSGAVYGYNVGSAHDWTISQIARTVNETLNLHAEAGTISATDSPAIREDVLRDPRYPVHQIADQEITGKGLRLV